MAAPAGHRPPRLDRYLLDGERVVFAVRRHWASVALPVLAAAAAVVLALVADAKFPRGAALIANLLLLASLVVVAWAAWRIIEWRHDWLVATDKRLLLSTGLFTQSNPMMPLARVTDMNYQRTVSGRMLGYGKFVMESAGQNQALNVINYMPDPDDNYRILVAEIFDVDPPSDEPSHAPPAHVERDDSAVLSSDRSTAIPVRGPRQDREPGQDRDSLYRSPDLRARDRSADTGPIKRYDGG